MPGWKKLPDVGVYNNVYRSDDGLEVLKIQKDSAVLTDKPERSVRLWNLLNPDLLPPARILEMTPYGRGWVCPFVQGRQSTDKERVSAFIHIFNSSGRIIVDALGAGNFLTTAKGQVVCVDIGMALQMEFNEEIHDAKMRGRRNSAVSIAVWNEFHEKYTKYFTKHRSWGPLTVDIVKSLLFIASHRSDICNDIFLKKKTQTVKILTTAYDAKAAKAEQMIAAQNLALKELDYHMREIPVNHAQSVAVPTKERVLETMQIAPSIILTYPTFAEKPIYDPKLFKKKTAIVKPNPVDRHCCVLQ